MVTYHSVFLPLIRLGASVTTLPATTLELELQAKLAAAQAQINALMEQRDKQQEGGSLKPGMRCIAVWMQSCGTNPSYRTI